MKFSGLRNDPRRASWLYPKLIESVYAWTLATADQRQLFSFLSQIVVGRPEGQIQPFRNFAVEQSTLDLAVGHVPSMQSTETTT